jgi:hypothetical protein
MMRINLASPLKPGEKFSFLLLTGGTTLIITD